MLTDLARSRHTIRRTPHALTPHAWTLVLSRRRARKVHLCADTRHGGKRLLNRDMQVVRAHVSSMLGGGWSGCLACGVYLSVAVAADKI